MAISKLRQVITAHHEEIRQLRVPLDYILSFLDTANSCDGLTQDANPFAPDDGSPTQQQVVATDSPALDGEPTAGPHRCDSITSVFPSNGIDVIVCGDFKIPNTD
jgi:hypothetical protein